MFSEGYMTEAVCKKTCCLRLAHFTEKYILYYAEIIGFGRWISWESSLHWYVLVQNTDSFIGREETHYMLSTVREINHYGSEVLIVWTGIMLNGDISLHDTKSGTVTSVKSRVSAMKRCVCLFMGAVTSGLNLLDDNKQPHETHVVDGKYSMECKTIHWIKSLVTYPDLNPIDHVWSALGREDATRNPPSPRNIQIRKSVLLNYWNQLPQNIINCLIPSINSRCESCTSVRGNHTSFNPFFLFDSVTTVLYLLTPMRAKHDHACVLFLCYTPNIFTTLVFIMCIVPILFMVF